MRRPLNTRGIAPVLASAPEAGAHAPRARILHTGLAWREHQPHRAAPHTQGPCYTCHGYSCSPSRSVHDEGPHTQLQRTADPGTVRTRLEQLRP